MMLSHIPLVGQHVTLAPLELGHAQALAEAGARGQGTFALTIVPDSLAKAQRYVAEALAQKQQGRALPYATIRNEDGSVVGSTRFGNLEYLDFGERSRPYRPGPDAVEIGWTWLTKDAQRTQLNSEAKWLMLSHAFEVWQVERVTLKTDARNARSRAAIERIGASFEGILRKNMPASDGGVRDTAYYSVIAEEWPRVRAELLSKLAR
jgi:RimJ/RimL family protein N-acetyltransferase